MVPHETVLPEILFVNGLNQSIKKLNVRLFFVVVKGPRLCQARLSQMSYITPVSGG